MPEFGPLSRCEISGTGVSVSRLGFGAAGVGNLYRSMPEQTARTTLEAALAEGIAYFDTAPFYGFGLSERRLGDALAGANRSTLTVSTKVGRTLVPIDPASAEAERLGFVDGLPYTPVFDYGYEAVRSGFLRSLERLRLERADIVLAHDLGSLTHGPKHPAHLRDFLVGGYRAMRELKDEGLIGAVGIGVNEISVCLEVLDEVPLDCILLAGRYTLLEQGALERLLPACLSRKVGIIIGGPFNSGVLAEAVGVGVQHYDYAPAPPDVLERVAALRRVCQVHGVSLTAAALQFPLAHPSVVAVVPGLSSPAQVRAARRDVGTSIPHAFWKELHSSGLIHPEAPTPGGSGLT